MAVEDLATDLRILDRHRRIRLDAGRTGGNAGPFCIYSEPHQGADVVFNSVMSGDLRLS